VKRTMLQRCGILGAFMPLFLGAVPLEIAPNGSFEFDRNRDGQPDGWKPVLFDSPAKALWVHDVAHTGRSSVLLADSAHPADRSWHANTARWVTRIQRTARPGQPVTATVWIRTRLTAGDAKIVLAWFSGSKWLHENGSQPVRGSSDWTRRSVTAQAPKNADRVAVYLILNNGRGQAWFDDVLALRGTRPPSDFRSIDIRAACNTGFRDSVAGDGRGGWTDQGANDLRAIPAGEQTFRGVPFDIVDPAKNGGRACIVLRGGHGRQDFANSASFDVGRKAGVLYFLHACAWAGRKGTQIGEYVVRYTDGKTLRVPLRVGREIFDWWTPADTDECAIGWQGTNAESSNIALGIFPWRNPRPDVVVRSVTARTSGKGPVLMLAAVTAGTGEPVFPELPIEYRFTDTAGWYTWDFPLDDPELGELDLSKLLDRPAGKHGFVRVDEAGHFRFADGTPVRFFGTNLVGARCCPTKEQARKWAARLAAYGVNLLRFHAFDSAWAPIIDASGGNTRKLDPNALERMDYFIAELRKRGVYVYLDLLDYRKFLPGDKVREADRMATHWEHSMKGASIFNPRLVELQKEYATLLLTHRNPFTGLRYVDDPAVAVVEITNENSVFYLSNERLILPSYAAELKKLWNRWLLTRYGTRTALAKAWTRPDGFCALRKDETPENGSVTLPTRHLYLDPARAGNDPLKAPERLTDVTRFLYEIETAYYRQMTAHLRKIGLKCPITGTNQDFSAASNRANAFCDVMTRNNYWCHPSVRAKPYPRFRNLSVIGSDLCTNSCPVTNVASSAVVGKPMISPEFNFPWPNEFRAESLPLMACYGSLQDWDGLLFFAYAPERKALSYFGNTKDPVRWGQYPMAALLFHRRDIDPARTTVCTVFSAKATFASRARRMEDPYAPYRIVPWISKLRNLYYDDTLRSDADLVLRFAPSATEFAMDGKRVLVVPGAGADTRKTPDLPGRRLHQHLLEAYARLGLPGAAPLSEAGRIFRSDTGQLLIDTRVRRFTAVAPRVRIVAGFFPAAGRTEPAVLGDVRVACRTPFATIGVIALDDAPDLRSSHKLLVTAVARAENTGQATLATGKRRANSAENERVVDADTGTLLPQKGSIPIAEFGREPVLAEPVDAHVTVPGADWKAFALDERGRRRTALPVQPDADGSRVELRNARSPWILLIRP